MEMLPFKILLSGGLSGSGKALLMNERLRSIRLPGEPTRQLVLFDGKPLVEFGPVECHVDHGGGKVTVSIMIGRPIEAPE